MKPKVFIDWEEGTTGLRIHEQLAGRGDIEVLKIDPEKHARITRRGQRAC